jgi:hypothetical protein
MSIFYVFNQAGDDGFHEIKDKSGSVIATAADTDQQTMKTLDAMGHHDAEVECVYDEDDWNNIGQGHVVMLNRIGQVMKVWLVSAGDDYGTYCSVIVSEEKPVLVCPNGVYTYSVEELNPTQNPSYPQYQEYRIQR